jgi:peptide/nickel transport system permease protein
MPRYITFRFFAIVPVLLVASIVSFALAKLTPGDITITLLGQYATDADRQALRQQLALDRPFYVQYERWLARAVRGDLGMSIQMREPVAQVLAQKFKNTLLLGLVAFMLAFAAGVTTGVISAAKDRTIADRTIQTILAFLATMPVFWLGLVLIYVFAIGLHVLPTGGMGPAAGGGDALTTLRYLALPAITTAVIPAAIIAKSARSAVLEVSREQFVVVARTKGLPEPAIWRRHVLKVAFPAVLHISGIQFAYLIGGTVVFSEVVFSWPGIGLQMFNAVAARDLPMIQGIVLLAALVSVAASLIVDLMHALLDPRVTVFGGAR